MPMVGEYPSGSFEDPSGSPHSLHFKSHFEFHNLVQCLRIGSINSKRQSLCDIWICRPVEETFKRYQPVSTCMVAERQELDDDRGSNIAVRRIRTCSNEAP